MHWVFLIMGSTTCAPSRRSILYLVCCYFLSFCLLLGVVRLSRLITCYISAGRSRDGVCLKRERRAHIPYACDAMCTQESTVVTPSVLTTVILWRSHHVGKILQAVLNNWLQSTAKAADVAIGNSTRSGERVSKKACIAPLRRNRAT